MTAALESYGLEPDITPQRPKMAALIRAASESAATVLNKKPRSASGNLVLALLPFLS